MTGTAGDLVVREMTRPELDLAVEWAAAEGWNPGLTDATPFHAADPGGFLVGLVDGEPVATVSAVRYGDDFAFAGFFIVRPGLRGHGYGLRLQRVAMERLGGRNVGLDGVVEQQANYRRSGFVVAHRNVRFETTCGVVARAMRTGGDAEPVELTTLPFEMLRAYDRGFFPAPRDAFLRAWIAQPGTVALGLLRDGRLAGCGVLRPCRVGFKVGPLFADSPDDAGRLFGALCARPEGGAAVFLDVPESNPAAVALASGLGMRRVFETARMYTGPAPDVSPDRTYGITSFELG